MCVAHSLKLKLKRQNKQFGLEMCVYFLFIECVCLRVSFVRTKCSLFLTCQFSSFALRNSIESHETKSVFTFGIGLSNKIGHGNKVKIEISSIIFAFKIQKSNNFIEIKHFCDFNFSQNSFGF